MDFVCPHTLRQFPRKRIAVVGNAASVLNWRAGDRIDSSDLVVRFNEARTDSFESSVGSRTDILFANVYNTLDKSPSPSTHLKPRVIICLLGTRDKDADLEAFRAWAGPCPTLFSWVPDLIPHLPIARTRTLTSGIYALHLVKTWLEPESLFITGFNAFLGEGNGHYWTRENPPAAYFHDLDLDAKYLRQILSDYTGQLELTPELEVLLGKRVGPPKRTLFQKITGRLSRVLLHWGFHVRRLSENA